MPQKKRTQARVIHRWAGYFVEDTQCMYCQYFQGRKHGCSLDKCCCLPEILDALVQGRIQRKRGSLKWDK